MDAATEKKDRHTKKKESNKYTREELEILFHQVDRDHNGCIDVKELAQLFRLLGLGYTAKSVKELLALIDDDETSTIELPEFLAFFSNQKKGADLGDMVHNALTQQALHWKPDGTHTDVYITHAMTHDVGYRKCWWLANVLENEGLTVSGPYINSVVEENDDQGFMKNTPSSPVKYKKSVELKRVPSISDCRLLILLVDRDSLVSTEETDVLDKAGDLGLPVLCFYEAEPGYVEDLIAWRESYPLAMANAVARPMTRYFPRDSADLCAHQVLQTLKRTRLTSELKIHAAHEIRVEHDDFSMLANLEDVRWLTPEFAMVMEPWSVDLPETAYGQPGRARPYYVSYPSLDLDKAGLSEKQLARLRILLQENTHEGQLLYIDSLCLDTQVERTTSQRRSSLAEVSKFMEIMLLSEFIILDEVDPDATSKKPYLARGHCFMEAVIAILTGNCLPTRQGQLEELDRAVGLELGAGSVTLRNIVHKNAKSPIPLINRLVSVLETKTFSSNLEKSESCRLFADMLTRHPHLCIDNKGKSTRTVGLRGLGQRLLNSASSVMKISGSSGKSS
mmetsp:Transcript_73461/g.185588  ORF Transcript_73461/g.185588 Transcript_73461/m.185588 type:complete len:563 (+) Transcript_73461:541-2229(+)